MRYSLEHVFSLFPLSCRARRKNSLLILQKKENFSCSLCRRHDFNPILPGPPQLAELTCSIRRARFFRLYGNFSKCSWPQVKPGLPDLAAQPPARSLGPLSICRCRFQTACPGENRPVISFLPVEVSLSGAAARALGGFMGPSTSRIRLSG